MLLGDQEHVEIRPQRAADIGEQEVDRVERKRIETPAVGCCHSHSHGVPITNVTMVSGAPTLKYSQKLIATPEPAPTLRPSQPIRSSAASRLGARAAAMTIATTKTLETASQYRCFGGVTYIADAAD
jgi:hypothetical protein